MGFHGTNRRTISTCKRCCAGGLGLAALVGAYAIVFARVRRARREISFPTLATELIVVTQLVYFIGYSPSVEQGLLLGVAIALAAASRATPAQGSEAMMRVAVIMTAHNRRETTLACLRSLERQELDRGAGLRIYLTDDGSVDGTTEAVRAVMPGTHIIAGDGSLYWNRGMLRAWRAAVAGDFDFYLWLNDDAILRGDAVGRLLRISEGSVIAVGATCDPAGGGLTYGGLRRRTGRLAFDLIPPDDHAVSCDTFNGTCVLIPRRVAERVGLLNAAFQHSLGDIDYGLRAGVPGARRLLRRVLLERAGGTRSAARGETTHLAFGRGCDRP